MRQKPTRGWWFVLLLLLATCGGRGGPAPTPAILVTVSPMQATVPTGQTQSFQATVQNTSNTNVIWRVNGATGGNASVGTITTNGVYTAPAAIPSPATVTVTAVSVADATKSASATVTITAANPVSITIVPANTSVTVGQTQTFTAVVSNASDMSVTWQVNGVTGGSATTGTIDQNGVFTAPATVPSPAAVTVTAVSHADSTKSATAAVTIVPSAGITVTIAPATATVQTGKTQAFTATVANSSNQSVVWEVNGSRGGNATVGTIDANGVYTAPASVPSPPTVTVTAVAQADSNRSASAQVTITSAAGVSVTLSPASVTVTTGKMQQFQASVINTSDTGVIWQVNGVTGGNTTVGTIDATGLYTAPAAVPSPAVVFVAAVAHADPSQSATAQVTIQAATGAQIRIAPGAAVVPAGKSQQFAASMEGGANPSVMWQVNGVPGGSAGAGTIDSTGLYTAPASVPSPGTVTITAIPATDRSTPGHAAASIVAAEADARQLKGTWSFRVEAIFYSTIGSFIADGHGHITQGQEDNGSGQITFTGTYAIARDGSGSAMLQLADGSRQQLQFVLGPDGSGPCQRSDQPSFGLLVPQSGVTEHPDLAGIWTVEVDSSDFTGVEAIAGSLALGTDGHLTGALQGISGYAPAATTLVSIPVTGGYRVGPGGRGSMTLVSDGYGMSQYIFDLSDSGHLFLLGTPGTGSATRQSPDTAFSAASVKGAYVLQLQANDLAGPPVSMGIESAQDGLLNFDGKGGLSGGVLDANVVGNLSVARAVAPARYTVDSQGKMEFPLSAPGVGPLAATVWLSSPDAGIAVGSGIFGPVQKSQPSRIPDASLLRGVYAVQLYGFDGENRRPEAFLGTLTADGAGKFSGAVQSFGVWSRIEGTYTLDASGRGTLQWDDGIRSRHFALTVVNDGEMELFGLDHAETLLGQLTRAMDDKSSGAVAAAVPGARTDHGNLEASRAERAPVPPQNTKYFGDPELPASEAPTAATNGSGWRER